MACTGHSNTPNGVPCTGHVGPVSPVSWASGSTNAGESVTAAEMDEVRVAINAELSRRGTSYSMFNVSPGINVSDGHYKQMRDALNACKPWTFPTAVDNTRLAPGATIRADGLNTIKNQVNTIKQECVCNCNYACTCDCNYCVCNCNYCVCNCNYCTCDCNYCTCDCNYCTCDCAYSCTCDCNYSDDRLKKDVEYL